MFPEKLIQALKGNGYLVSFFPTAETAADYLAAQVQGCTVGFGDSATLAALKLAERLALENRVYDPGACSAEDFFDQGKMALTAEVFFTSVNGVAETGELVNIDATGNRLAGSLFGHQKVYFVFGTNKIEPTLERAIWRARNMAAPQNARRLSCRTPCAVRGDRCYDCSSPDRICNAMVIHFRKLDQVKSEIVIIDEALGL